MSWEAVLQGMQGPHSGAHCYFMWVPRKFEHVLCVRIPTFVHLHFPIGGARNLLSKLIFQWGLSCDLRHIRLRRRTWKRLFWQIQTVCRGSGSSIPATVPVFEAHAGVLVARASPPRHICGVVRAWFVDTSKPDLVVVQEVLCMAFINYFSA